MRVERTAEEVNNLVEDMVLSWMLAKDTLYHIPRPSKEGVCSVYDPALTTDALRARAVALVYHCLTEPVTVDA